MVSSYKSIIFSLLFLGFFLPNAYFWQSTEIGLVLALFYFSYFGFLFGKVFASSFNKWAQFLLGTTTLLSLFMIIGSIAYFLVDITPVLSQSIILLTIPMALFAGSHEKQPSLLERLIHFIKDATHRIPKSTFGLMAIVLLSLATILSIVSAIDITGAVRSPWLQLPTTIFMLFGIAAFGTLALALRAKEYPFIFMAISGLVFVTISIAANVYPLGFGFDSFIHKATESHIALEGTINPKPFYYTGQYILIVFLNHAFSLPIELSDTWLLPLLTAALLPLAWLYATESLFKEKRFALQSLIGLFLLPLGVFILTTPQGIANLLTILTILLSIPYLQKPSLKKAAFLILPALAALLTHPIAGIPICIYLSLLLTNPKIYKGIKKWLARFIFWLIAIGGTIVLPASFLINAIRSGQELTLNLDAITGSSIAQALSLNLFTQNQFSLVLNFVYLIGFNLVPIILILSLFGIIHQRKHISASYYIPLILTVMLFINYFLLSTVIDFTFLIDYERSNYANRLIPLMLFALSPYLLLGLEPMVKRLSTSPIALKVSYLVFGAAFMTSVFYLSYPRHDGISISRGFNVAEADIAAVRFIEDIALDDNYVVLANQSVGAAAITEIGFTRYFGDQFFYPIPTGNEFYQYFLEMNEEPNIGTINRAIAHINDQCEDCDRVDTLYYVVNEYWWQAPIIIEKAKTTTPDWYPISDGSIHIFKYTF